MDNEKWQVEGLIKRAFERTKTRFLSYFLTWVASFGMMFGSIILFFLLAGLVYLVFTISQSVILSAVVGIILGVLGYVGFIFVMSWVSLATISVLIDDEKLGVGATFSKVRPMVWGYFWLQILSGLFLMGLLPFGILSLGVVFILWSLWSSFSIFVYLKFQKKGLQSLWISREMFLQKAWAIFGRMLIVNIALFAVSFMISLGGGKNGATQGLSVLLSMVTAPFVVCFNYEMFLNLEPPKEEVKKPSVWFALSVIGGILMVLLLVLGIGSLVMKFSEIVSVFGLKGIEDMYGLKNINQITLPTPTIFPIQPPTF